MKKACQMNRRIFLKRTSGAAAASSIVPALISLAPEPTEASPSPLNKWPGRVVINYNNKHAATQTGGTAADKTILMKMVDDSIKLLTGETTVGAAWKALFPATGTNALSSTTKIAIKINLLSSGVVPGHPFIVMAIVEGLMQMNVGTTEIPATLSRANINIYDANNSNCFNAKGYNATNFPGITLTPSDTLSNHGDGSQGYNYANSLKNADFLINIPGIRGHGSEWGNATLGFKSHLGTYPASAAHGNGPTRLRDYNCVGPVYNKTVLTVANAIYATNYNNGPTSSSNPDNYNRYAKTMDSTVATTRVNCDTIIMSADPVAAEFQMHKIMCLNSNPVKAYTVASMPTYLKISAGVAVGSNTVYNIGILDEAQQYVGKIINEVQTGWTQKEIAPHGQKNDIQLKVSPNPVNTMAYFDIWTPIHLSDKKILLEIYTIQGRLIYSNKSPIYGACTHLTWSAMHRNNKPVAAGKYIAYLMIGGELRQTTFTVIR